MCVACNMHIERGACSLQRKFSHNSRALVPAVARTFHVASGKFRNSSSADCLSARTANVYTTLGGAWE
jgi:hypothetical protein